MPRGFRAKTFLSCSIRKADRRVVEFFKDDILCRYGFDCLTIGLNYSDPRSVGDAMKRLMRNVDCLVLVATVRFESRDTDTNEGLFSMSPFLEAELAMAIMAGVPIGIFKSEQISEVGLISHIVGLPFDRRRYRVALKKLEDGGQLSTYLGNLLADARNHKEKRKLREQLLLELSSRLPDLCQFCGHKVVREKGRRICPFCRAVFE